MAQASRSTFGTADKGGIGYYQLDNEMALWSSTHADVRPAPPTSAEVWSTTTDIASVIRNADPKAFILGYGTWYVADLLHSAAEDAGMEGESAHGNVPLAQWYLRQLAQARTFIKRMGAPIRPSKRTSRSRREHFR